MAGHKNHLENNFPDISKKLRRVIIEASYRAHACHIGSALSCVDIIWNIYNKMGWRDIFIFSKASGACALYAVLAERGYFPESKVAYYLKKYPLGNMEVPGVFLNSGSLGHGLPMAVGVALAQKEYGTKDRVYCLMSDAELQEGTTYESALFARQHNLDNLYVVVDYNSWQACGRIKDILDLKTAIKFLKETLPHFRVVKTIKGSGISFMENNNSYHYKNLNENTYKKAIRELA